MIYKNYLVVEVIVRGVSRWGVLGYDEVGFYVKKGWCMFSILEMLLEFLLVWIILLLLLKVLEEY